MTPQNLSSNSWLCRKMRASVLLLFVMVMCTGTSWTEGHNHMRCPVGNPLKGSICEPNLRKCPAQYACKIIPSKKFGVCCPACPGNPPKLPEGVCSKCRKCPSGKSCITVGELSMCCWQAILIGILGGGFGG